MPTLKPSYGAATAVTISLNSLANNSSATGSTVSNAVDLFTDALLEVTIVTGGTVVTTGFCEIWVKGSIDNTDFATDGADRKIATIATATASTTYKTVLSVASGFGGILPQYWQLRIRNASGGALASSGHSVAYSGVSIVSV